MVVTVFQRTSRIPERTPQQLSKYIPTYIVYTGSNPLLGSPNPDLARVVSFMQSPEAIFNGDEVLQHHSQHHTAISYSRVFFFSLLSEWMSGLGANFCEKQKPRISPFS